MYIPSKFAEQDVSVVSELTAQHPLAHVITAQGGELLVNLFPVLVTRGETGFVARFHVARSNPQLRHLLEAPSCIISFSGPNCYVSPTWYEEHPNVPSWNYLAVQLFGPVEVLEDAELEQLLRDLTLPNEASVGGSWRYEDMPEAFRLELLAEIQGFRMNVERVEAKSKLSQNRLPGDQQRVIQKLLASDAPNARAVGAWMRRKFPLAE
jgi:transcriptional regulator